MKLKTLLVLVCALLVSFFLFVFKRPSKSQVSLKVFVNETFAGSTSCYDFDDKIRSFEEAENVKIEWISYGNSIQSLLERMKSDPSLPIDLLYGVDNTNLVDFQESDLFHVYKSKEDPFLLPEIKLDKRHFFTPISYGWLALEYSDKVWKKSLPKSFADLNQPLFKGNYILANPRTSDVGFLLALWLNASGEKVEEVLPLLLKNSFNVAPSWSSAYTLYVSGEAPFILTYSSSPAYHASLEGDNSQKTVLDNENSYLQIEFLGIAKRSCNISVAERFLDFMVSKEVQQTLPEKIWIFPARMNTKLPPEFEKLKRPKHLLSHNPEEIKALREAWMESSWF